MTKSKNDEGLNINELNNQVIIPIRLWITLFTGVFIAGGTLVLAISDYNATKAGLGKIDKRCQALYDYIITKDTSSKAQIELTKKYIGAE